MLPSRLSEKAISQIKSLSPKVNVYFNRSQTGVTASDEYNMIFYTLFCSFFTTKSENSVFLYSNQQASRIFYKWSIMSRQIDPKTNTLLYFLPSIYYIFIWFLVLLYSFLEMTPYFWAHICERIICLIRQISILLYCHSNTVLLTVLEVSKIK